MTNSTTSSFPPPGPAGSTPPPPAGPRCLRRSRTDRRVAGVCGGIAEYLNADPVVVRLVMVGLFLGGIGFLIYPIVWIIAPNAEPTPATSVGGPYDSGALYRSNTDRRLAGVCGGIAEYFGIDPVIVRLIMVVLLISGIGFLIYPLAWIIVPRAPHGYLPRSSRTDREPLDIPVWVWFAGAVALILASVDVLNWTPLGLVALAAGLYLMSRQPAAAPSAAAPAPAAVRNPSAKPTQPNKPAAEMTDDELHAAAEWTDEDLGFDEPPFGPDPGQPAPRRRRRGLVPAVTLGVLALVVVGAVSTSAGGFGHGVGDRTYVATTLTELSDEYRLTAGTLVVDLSDLDLQGETRSVQVKIGAGELDVIVPRDAGGTVNAELGAGELGLEGFGRMDVQAEGLGQSIGPVALPGENGVINIEISANVGEVTIRHPGP